MPIQKSLNQLLAFLNLHQYAKSQFMPSIYSWNTATFRVPWPDWPHLFWPCPTKIFLKIFMWICINKQNIRRFYWFILEIWLTKKSCSLIGWYFGPYLRNKNFPKIWDLHRNIANNINFHYRTNLVNIINQVF